MHTILITGAGSGIGKATAIRLSPKKNTRIILAGRRLEKLEEVKSELVNPSNHIAISVDVSKKDSLTDLLASDKANLAEHPLVAVFANAGVGGPNFFGPGDRWKEIIDINLTGAYNTCMASHPWLVKAGEAGIECRHIAITSSCLARFGVPGLPAYISSKTAIMGLVRGLAVEWSQSGIYVNAIAPGWVDTEMAKESIQSQADILDMSYEDMLKEVCSVLPTGRMSKPNEIAALVEFLFSNAQRSIVGTTIDINNGSWMG
ncbi:MAG: short-chain dehydrogenase [Crocinitomicaceae bacterium]|nr:short-chain dehydrogenase [Crocinitomicaceae bacterium]